MKVPFMLLRKGSCLPRRGTEQSAGLDLCACIEQSLTIPAGKSGIVPTGIAAALPKNTVGLVFARSGLGMRYGIVPSNAVGVIDADFRGEIQVGLRNQSDVDYVVKPNERIAQLVIVPVFMGEACAVDVLPATERGDGGLGSTGKI